MNNESRAAFETDFPILKDSETFFLKRNGEYLYARIRDAYNSWQACEAWLRPQLERAKAMIKAQHNAMHSEYKDLFERTERAETSRDEFRAFTERECKHLRELNEKMEGECARLRIAIGYAPHGNRCAVYNANSDQVYCDCWQVEALRGDL